MLAGQSVLVTALPTEMVDASALETVKYDLPEVTAETVAVTDVVVAGLTDVETVCAMLYVGVSVGD